MTFRITDVGSEAQLVEVAERLSEAITRECERGQLLDLDPDYLDAAKTMLSALSGQVVPLPSGTVALTEQQIQTFLDFDPDFLEVAKDMLREFIEKTASVRNSPHR